MSSPGFSAPLRIEPARSKQLAWALAGLYAAGFAALAGLPGSLSLRGLAMLALAVHAAWTVRRELLRPTVSAAEWTQTGTWRVRLAGHGAWVEAHVDPRSLVTRRLAILHFRLASGARVKLLVMPDAVDPEVLRRLCLRWGSQRTGHEQP